MLSSQDINPDTISKSSRTTGSVGTTTIDGTIYNQVSLRPEIPFGNLDKRSFLDNLFVLNSLKTKSYLTRKYPIKNKGIDANIIFKNNFLFFPN